MTPNARKHKNPESNLQQQQQHQLISKIQAHIRGYNTRKNIVLRTQIQFQKICQSVWKKISSRSRLQSVATAYDSRNNYCSLSESSLFYTECIPLWTTLTQQNNHLKKHNYSSLICKPKFVNKQKFKNCHLIEINKKKDISVKLNTILHQSQISPLFVESETVSNEQTNVRGNTLSYHKDNSLRKTISSTKPKMTFYTRDTHLAKNSNERSSSMKLLHVNKNWLIYHDETFHQDT